MSSRPLSRRTLLRGLGNVAIALPFLEAMSARAQTAPAFPTRFVAVFNPNGNVASSWTPSGSETSFQLGPILSPLAPHVSKCLFLSGIDMESTYHGPGEGHMMGMGGLLTGTELQSGSLFSDGSGTPAGWGGGISVDQELARRVGGQTRFASLELGVQVPNNTVWDRISYLGPGQPLPPETNPLRAFERIFTGVVSSGGQPAAPSFRERSRKSVLDTVQADLGALKKQLGAADQKKVDAHLTAVRSIEQRLSAMMPVTTTAACTPPSAPAQLDVNATSSYQKIGELQIDLLVMALACGLTRVGTLQWSYSRSSTYFPWLGIPSPGHHSLSHYTDSASVAKLASINTWYSTQFATLLSKLDAVREGDGTLLDHSVVLWGNELSDGAAHSRRAMPFVLAGGGGGRLRTGRFLRYSSVPHNNLLVSCLNACGVEATTFGNPSYCTGPLTGLT